MIPDCVWVLLPSGPLTSMRERTGANQPAMYKAKQPSLL
jgi:hypothetical protein